MYHFQHIILVILLINSRSSRSWTGQTRSPRITTITDRLSIGGNRSRSPFKIRQWSRKCSNRPVSCLEFGAIFKIIFAYQGASRPWNRRHWVSSEFGFCHDSLFFQKWIYSWTVDCRDRPKFYRFPGRRILMMDSVWGIKNSDFEFRISVSQLKILIRKPGF